MATRKPQAGLSMQTHLRAGTCQDLQNLTENVRDVNWPWCQGTPYELGCRIKTSQLLSYRQPEIQQAAGCY